ncbi:sulfite exporter TauE/SafE family protein [Aureibaculum sp. 2210JD6-5]|uniref:sulfite exporter TauE/SafE family protein n=1 Tax=Aureibaculum sp. 2210JD6-5 TaxID=3103957 RepID=UPI002AACD44D|nr:sulfite exporter TauE/SafE family protein [Aureibaculum sp. 2210JD6-5]MDY7395222.1 sulfite exporter TauE/SafE family protein [Aureibaculum sp. 2210JD6-5]
MTLFRRMVEFSELSTVFFQYWEIILLFFMVAILYASIGFGGGSSYLAILALTGLSFIQFRAIALLCNIVVVTGGTLIYIKNGYFNWKKIVPLTLMSVPLAFLGGYLKISQTFFFILLGLTLVVAAVLMWISNYLVKSSGNIKPISVAKNSVLGGFIGFISGMVGIGGGVFLSPLLHLTHWDTPKKIAATSSFFILVNSIAGLFGQYLTHFDNTDFNFDTNLALLLMITVLIGGQIGSRLSTSKLSPFVIKRMTAILIAIVGLRILWKSLVD